MRNPEETAKLTGLCKRVVNVILAGTTDIWLLGENAMLFIAICCFGPEERG